MVCNHRSRNPLSFSLALEPLWFRCINRDANHRNTLQIVHYPGQRSHGRKSKRSLKRMRETKSLPKRRSWLRWTR